MEDEGDIGLYTFGIYVWLKQEITDDICHQNNVMFSTGAVGGRPR
jgi:hypothetical protein